MTKGFEKKLLLEVYAHWDNKEELCPNCKPFWLAYTNAERKEIRRTYESEKET